MTGPLLQGLGPHLGGLPYLKRGRARQASSYDRTGGNRDFISLKPGETATLMEADGAGSIARMWVTTQDWPDPGRFKVKRAHILRKLLLRAYWDGETVPSIDCPLGDFFGAGFAEYREYHSLVMGMSSGGFYSYFPMPFGAHARVEIVNESDEPVPHFYYAVTYLAFDRLDEDVGRFHAKWRRATTEAGTPYTLLEAKGRGHFAGCILSMQQAPWKQGFDYLEGDEQIYIDGEPFPSIHGTGTEDYFNAGWYFLNGAFAAPYHGVILKDDMRSRIIAYRFHIADPIPFERSLRVDMEHGGPNADAEAIRRAAGKPVDLGAVDWSGANDTPGCDYASVAYWYQTEPHTDFAPMPPVEKRLPGPEL
jgi:hypothetical protein